MGLEFYQERRSGKVSAAELAAVGTHSLTPPFTLWIHKHLPHVSPVLEVVSHRKQKSLLPCRN